MPLAYHAVKQVNTHADGIQTRYPSSTFGIRKGLRHLSVSSSRALHLGRPPSPATTFKPLSPIAHRKRKQKTSICYASSPEKSFPSETNNTRGNKTNTNSTTTSGGTRKISVAIETAKELAAREFTWFDSLRELLGHTGNDPGHWNFSPEWWGSQGGSFGRTDGQVVFSKISKFNGLVEVTAHSASINGFSSDISSAFGDETRQEWRVLRFNKVTRQSVSRCGIISNGGSDGSSARIDMQQRRWLESGQSIIAHPECVAAEYLKTITSVFGALLGLQGLFQSSGMSTSTGATTSPLPTSRRSLKVLCIGLGGGTLPHFIAHHFPQADVDAVEIDPIVVEAAIEAMGLPVTTLTNLHLHIQDGFEFLKTRSSKNSKFSNSARKKADPSLDNSNSNDHILYDVVCIDAFDGEDNVPPPLCSPEFVNLLGSVLNKNHGTVLMNFHDTLDVASIGKIFYDILVLDGGNSTESDDTSTGCCFTVDTQKQRNVTLAVARGLELPFDTEEAKERLRYAGVYVGHESGYRFPAGVRAERGFVRVF